MRSAAAVFRTFMRSAGLSISLCVTHATMVLALLTTSHSLNAAEPAHAQLDEKHRVFFTDNCVECHNEKKHKGKLRLDDISFAIDPAESADRWQKILNQLNSGEMPPDDAKQPEAGAKTEFLDSLSHSLMAARRSLGDSGGKITMRRLNRREYRNTIRDLLGVEIDARDLPAGSPRGGLLGMAAVLAMGSNGERTSPVERGAWVLRKLLHDPPPPAPPNVPQLARLEGKILITRERMLAHQEEPQCASCQRKIDPIGFGLENFNAAGKWCTEDSYGPKTWPIDPAGAFHHGPAFNDYFQLRDLIAAEPAKLALGFFDALIEYALGRPCGFADEELMSTMVEEGKKKDFALRKFIHTLVSSRQFQSK